MKNIFNKIGATTKATAIGIGMGVVTLAVGAAVVFNAMDDSGISQLPTQRGAAYSDSQYGTGSGSGVQYGSSMASDTGSAGALKAGGGGSAFDFGRDRYGNPIRSNASADAASAADSAASGEFSAGQLASASSAKSKAQADAAAQQAAAQQAAAQQAAMAQANAAMASANKGASFGSGSSSSSFGSGSASGGFKSSGYNPQFAPNASNTDSSAQSLAANNLANANAAGSAAKGRVSDMRGAAGVARGAGGAGGSGQYGSNMGVGAKGNLTYLADARKGLASQDAGKVAADSVSGIFQGSTESAGLTEIGASVGEGQSAYDSLNDFKNNLSNPSNIAPVLTDTCKENPDACSVEGSKNGNAMKAIALGLAGGLLGLYALAGIIKAARLATVAWPLWVAAAALAAVIIAGMMLMLRECQAIGSGHGSGEVSPVYVGIAWVIGGLITAAVGLSFIFPEAATNAFDKINAAVKTKAAKVKNFFSKSASGGTGSTGGGGSLTKSVSMENLTKGGLSGGKPGGLENVAKDMLKASTVVK